MKHLARNLVLCAATAATVLSAMPMAEARDRRGDRRDHRPPVVRHHDRTGEAVAAGIIGLALGAIVIGSLSQRQNGTYVENPYRRPRRSPERNFFPAAPSGYADEVEYAGSLEPWSPGWYDYCEDRYRSFIPATGTYTTYGGEKRFCIAE